MVSTGSGAQLVLVGCGDVAVRSYLPAILRMSDRAALVGVCDPDAARRGLVVELVTRAGGCPVEVAGLGELNRHVEANGALIVAPARHHARLSLEALESGLHVYSEKPIAETLREADDLIRAAEARDRLLLCAPAVWATPTFRAVRAAVDAGAIGRLLFASAFLGNMGPAAWHEYTGDPRPFYETGPLLDQGVYLLHYLTGLLGPVVDVEAIESEAVPERTSVTTGRGASAFRIGAPDHVLLQLHFHAGAVAQVVSSYAIHATRRPALELHGTEGSLSVDDAEAALSPYFVSGGNGEWEERPVAAPEQFTAPEVVETGPQHFVDVLTGSAEPVLDAHAARHVVAVAAAAREAAQEGRRTAVRVSGDRS